MIDEEKIANFREIIWGYYHEHQRDLPWRTAESDGRYDPYKIMVSEVMLQQTQVTRVIPKYQEFLERFPNVKTLAQSSLADVLSSWNGLGYNRRAKFLWQAAQHIEQDYNGAFPNTLDKLITLPGIGKNTAGAILAYAYNQPVPFIETNIRTIYLHHFFKDEQAVSDQAIREVVAQTIDSDHPREWYWALMDYGAHLKATIGNVSRNSKHYAKQSTFSGSRRQIRGRIIKLLTKQPYLLRQLAAEIDDDRFLGVVTELEHESLIQVDGEIVRL